MSDSRLYWIGFNLVRGIGAVRVRRLLDAFGDLETAWNAPTDALVSAGLSQKLAQEVERARSGVDLNRVWQELQKKDIQAITWEEESYPRRLREIDQPPPVLYLRGELASDDDWAVAIVGTRRITPYGRQITADIAVQLANRGVTVVSGLARGVDAAAHQAALDAGGRTLAVLGSGVDRIYPPEHRRLAEQIIQHGALLSDYPPGTQPDAVNFPPRNRIISGLSIAVVIVEAGVQSGALITANFAAEQGREVFAVPGNINAPQSIGTNRLIQQGARPLLNLDELLETLNLTLISEHRQARQVLPADEVEKQLLDMLSSQPMHVDEIRNQANLPIERVTAALAMMELKGMVRQVGGMQYISVREASGDYLASQGSNL